MLPWVIQLHLVALLEFEIGFYWFCTLVKPNHTFGTNSHFHMVTYEHTYLANKERHHLL